MRACIQGVAFNQGVSRAFDAPFNAQCTGKVPGEGGFPRAQFALQKNHIACTHLLCELLRERRGGGFVGEVEL